MTADPCFRSNERVEIDLDEPLQDQAGEASYRSCFPKSIDAFCYCQASVLVETCQQTDTVFQADGGARIPEKVASIPKADRVHIPA